MAFSHKSVLLNETIEGLKIKPDGIYVDGTLGGGGHQIISGGNSDLFSNRKERGSELFISRLTLVLGMIFFIISFIMEFI